MRGTEPTGAPPCYSTLEAISKHRREDDEVFRACLDENFCFLNARNGPGSAFDPKKENGEVEAAGWNSGLPMIAALNYRRSQQSAVGFLKLQRSAGSHKHKTKLHA